MNRFQFLARTVSPAALALLIALPAAAQTAPAAKGETIEEIIVTAQKREERLVQVPVAVTAVSGETLREARINTVSDLSAAVPSLTFTQSTNEQNSSMRVRGVGSALFGTGFESSVSIVLDGVVLARQGQGFTDLIDVERVEVLRGPQGTLFGKNASAGVINVVTKRPADRFEAFGDVSYAEGDEYKVRGSVSGPLSDTVGARLTGFYTDTPGHIKNVANGSKINGVKSHGLRGQLAWKPQEDLNVLLLADWRKSKSTCCQYQSRLVGNPLFAAALSPVVPSSTNDQVNLDGFVGGGTDQWGLSGQIEYDIPLGRLTSITAYRTWDFSNNQDVDGTNNPVPLKGLTQMNLNGGTTAIKQTSQELRLDSPSDKVFEYTLGLYYFGLEIDRYFARRLGACLPAALSPAFNPNTPAPNGAPCPVPTYSSVNFNSSIDQKSYAAFGQGTYHLTEELSAIAGFRYQSETQKAQGNRPGNALFPGDIDTDPNTPNPPLATGATNPLLGLRPASGSASVSDTDLSGKAGLRYAFNPNAQVYATWSRGYKGRAFDTELTQNFAAMTALAPETSSSWEVGAKGIFFDGRLSVNAAAYLSKFKNLQIQGFDRDAALFRALNAGESKVKGVEVEFMARPGAGFTFMGGATFNDAKTDVDGLSCYPGQNTLAFVAGQALSANTCYRVNATTTFQNVRNGRLPNAPDLRVSLTARYDYDIESLPVGLFVQSTVVHQSKVIFDVNQDPLTQQDGYETVNLSAGFRDDDERYEVTLFINNLMDKSYTSAIARDPLSAVSTIHWIPKNAQRIFGGSVRVSF